uniref:Cation/H+ exchanger domain-containing protein n=1 Tax=Kalanchoe fedtschenkoi TaxID=63787 RepID=A0A7N0THH4_KALFE
MDCLKSGFYARKHAFLGYSEVVEPDKHFHNLVQKMASDPAHATKIFVCHSVDQINSKGIFYGDDPLIFSLPLLLMQLSLISIITRIAYAILKPFGQPMIVSQILGGVILGPSILGHNSSFAAKVFPPKGITVLDTMSVFGFMLFIFLIGVKIDPTMVLKSGRKAVAIGILGSTVPCSLAGLVAFIISRSATLDEDIVGFFPLAVAVMSLTAFPVVAIFLAELKILNSEIGRLASSSSIICDLCQWTIISVIFAFKIATFRSFGTIMGTVFSAALLIFIVVFGFRPVALWIVRHTPDGKPVKEIYIFAVMVALLGCGFAGEFFGLSALFAAFILGLVIPDGPPLGAALVERLDCFVSVLLMPLFFTNCGLQTDVFAIMNWRNVVVLYSIAFSAFIGKILGTIGPPLFFRMPVRDSISLALIMNSKGIAELALLTNWKRVKVIDEECFAIMIISVVVVTGVISPLVKTLYDPSRRFIAYKRRTILHARANDELRILVCQHSPDNVQATISLVEASNPTTQSPINLVVLRLVKLEGRASSLLIAHRQRERQSYNPTQSERIFNAFTKFADQRDDSVTVHCFEGIAPYGTMHNDVCSLALEKRTTLIILPFHKKWMVGDRMETSYALRHLNKNVLDKAPCSVGILIDHKTRKRPRSAFAEQATFRVMTIFFGGADDREALAYGRRMAENPNLTLTVIRFYATNDIVAGTVRSRMLDMEILGQLKASMRYNERIEHREELVSDGFKVLSVIKSMENQFDLVMVGRRHGESRYLSDLRKWNDGKGELGTLGELFAASDFKSKSCVLVVQQQTRVWGLHDPEESTRLRRLDS